MSRDKYKTQNARMLRQNMTDAEKRIWAALRNRNLGFKFKRQEPIGQYIVDFICREKNLIIEIDGGQHADSTSDRIRETWLTHEGFKILRFWNNEVLQQTEAVLLKIHNELECTGSSPPSGGED